VLEWITLENAARIAIVDGGTERSHLFVVVPLIAELECVDSGANHLLDATGASGRDLCFGEANDFFGQFDSAHGVLSVKPLRSMPKAAPRATGLG
jgi:hypothetical protein